MAKDRANDPNRVYQNPISNVNVLRNEPDSGEYDYHGSPMNFTGKGKDWRDKKFSDAKGDVTFKPGGGNREHYEASVSMRGAFGMSKEDHETANEARQHAYNNASADSVNKRKEITKKGAEDIERKNKGRGLKAKVIKINSGK
jgi:hypothetical protein